MEDESTEADDESEIISVHGPLSFLWCDSEGVTFEQAIGRAGPVSETDTTSHRAGLPLGFFSIFK